MKFVLTTAALALSTVPMLAQAGETGVAHPDQTPISADSGENTGPQKAVTTSQKAKPSAYVPYVAVTPIVIPPSPRQPVATERTSAPFNPDAEIVTTNAPVRSSTDADDSVYKPYRPYTPGSAALNARPADRDIDADIVTDVPLRAGEMPEGTLLRVQMNDALSTRTTERGSIFTATLSQDVTSEGRVVIPAGSTLDGMVTEVRGGKRITGRAAIHLEPRRVTLPDGSYYNLHAQVIDAGQERNVRVNEEGTIVRRDHAKETLAIVTATTGSAAVAGALIGGGVGAAVGAGIGAGISTVLWLKQDRQEALPRNTPLTFSLTRPIMMRPMQDGAQLRP